MEKITKIARWTVASFLILLLGSGLNRGGSAPFIVTQFTVTQFTLPWGSLAVRPPRISRSITSRQHSPMFRPRLGQLFELSIFVFDDFHSCRSRSYLVSVQALLQGAVQFTTIPDSATRRMN